MKKTDRQQIIDHFVDRGFAYNDPIDLAFYLAEDRQKADPQLATAKEYVEKVLSAGYRSELTKLLCQDIKKAVDETMKSQSEKNK